MSADQLMLIANILAFAPPVSIVVALLVIGGRVR